MSSERLIEPDDDFQRWIDGLLTASEARPAAPAELGAGIRAARKRTRRWAIARRVATAAAVMAIACWAHSNQVGVHRPAGPPPTIADVPQSPPVATFVAHDDMIAVAHESPAPNVTIVEVYPTTSAQRHWERQALLESALRSYDGG